MILQLPPLFGVAWLLLATCLCWVVGLEAAVPVQAARVSLSARAADWVLVCSDTAPCNDAASRGPQNAPTPTKRPVEWANVRGWRCHCVPHLVPGVALLLGQLLACCCVQPAGNGASAATGYWHLQVCHMQATAVVLGSSSLSKISWDCVQYFTPA